LCWKFAKNMLFSKFSKPIYKSFFITLEEPNVNEIISYFGKFTK
jgi:hypothetical protein